MANVRDKNKRLIGCYVTTAELSRINALCIKLRITRSEFIRREVQRNLPDRAGQKP